MQVYLRPTAVFTLVVQTAVVYPRSRWLAAFQLVLVFCLASIFFYSVPGMCLGPRLSLGGGAVGEDVGAV